MLACNGVLIEYGDGEMEERETMEIREGIQYPTLEGRDEKKIWNRSVGLRSVRRNKCSR